MANLKGGSKAGLTREQKIFWVVIELKVKEAPSVVISSRPDLICRKYVSLCLCRVVLLTHPKRHTREKHNLYLTPRCMNTGDTATSSRSESDEVLQHESGKKWRSILPRICLLVPSLSVWVFDDIVQLTEKPYWVRFGGGNLLVLLGVVKKNIVGNRLVDPQVEGEMLKWYCGWSG